MMLNDKARRITLFAAVLAVALRTAVAQEAAKPAPQPAPPPAAPAKPAPAQITPEAMQEVTWTGLTDAQKQLAFSIASEQRCDCGCSMTLAECRVKDSKCGRSLALVNQVVDLAKQGKSKDEIVKTAFAPPPTKFVQFALAPGEAPSVGPADAKVTILYYLDYQ